jgi:glycosyltransferase involved in cell wall biosynthesis
MIKLKIAIVNQPFGTIVLPWTGKAGSLDIWTYEVARRLTRSCDVIVYTRRDRHQKEVEYDHGVEYRHISIFFDKWHMFMSRTVDKLTRIPGFNNLRHSIFNHNVKRPFFASNLYYFAYALQVAQDLRKEKCDIVHIINFSQFIPIIRALNHGLKIVLHMQCEWLTQLDYKMVENRLKEVALIISCSEYVTKKTQCRFPQFTKHFRTIYNGVDLNHFIHRKENKTNQNEIRLLYVGRISPEKGIHVILDAFNKVVQNYPKAHLIIVGSYWQLPFEYIVALSEDKKVTGLASFYQGVTTEFSLSYFRYIQNKILSMNLSNNVTFTGQIPHQKIRDFLADATMLINASFSDAFPMPIPEAMASELPVIATNVGGIPEAVVDGKTGILVEVGNANKLSEAIIRLLSDKDLRRLMGKAAQKRAVELYSWDKIVKQILRQYIDLCEYND